MPGATQTLLRESQTVQTPHPEERSSLVICPQHPSPFYPLSTVFPRSHIQGQLSEGFGRNTLLPAKQEGAAYDPYPGHEHWKIDEQNVGPGRHCHTEPPVYRWGTTTRSGGGILPQTQGRVFIFVATSVLPASGTPCSVSVTEVIK